MAKEDTNNSIYKNKNASGRLLEKLVYLFLKIISVLPFWFIYILADLFYLIVRYIAKYRKKVITENLTFAFPEKTKEEIKTIRNKFYRHMCDLALEMVKQHGVSTKALKKRVTFKGLEAINQLYDEGRSFIIMAVHYNNWEWSSLLPEYMRHLEVGVYNPVRNSRQLEKFILHSREKWGGTCVPTNKSVREIFNYNKNGTLTALFLVADQTPPPSSKFWTIFLNREAPFFEGPEKIAIKTNQPIFFQHVKKQKRGHYEIDYIELVKEPQELDSKEILLRYVRKTEEIIRENPEFYLWSHRRWKYKRPEGIPLTL